MFNCELWTKPEWSFGWPPTLFVWMGRWCAGLVCLALVSLLRIDGCYLVYYFGVLDLGLWLGVGLWWLSLLCLLDIFDILYWCWHVLYDDMTIWRLYLLWIAVEMNYLNDDVMMFLFCCNVWENYVCVLGELLKK